MKTTLQLFCALGIAFFFAGQVRADSADTNPPPRLTVELRDGSRVVGESVENSFKFHSALLGDFKLQVKDIRAVDCVSSNSIKLSTSNGDTLTVAFVNPEFALKTGFGKVDLAAVSVRKFSVSAGGNGGHPPGQVALWSGEGNADDSVGGCNGQLIGSIGYTDGKVGQAFDLRNGTGGDNFPRGISFGGGSSVRVGSFVDQNRLEDSRSQRGVGNGFVQIPTSPALDVGKEDGFTFECWIKPVSVTQQMLIAEYERVLGTGSGSDVGIQLGMNGGCLTPNIKDVADGDHPFTSPANLLVAGVWQHVALTYDKSSGQAALYINGTAATQANLGSFTPQTSFAYLLLGARTTFGSVSSPRSVFSGQMDEIGLYNRALSAAEIRDEYEAGNKH